MLNTYGCGGEWTQICIIYFIDINIFHIFKNYYTLFHIYCMRLKASRMVDFNSTTITNFTNLVVCAYIVAIE